MKFKSCLKAIVLSLALFAGTIFVPVAANADVLVMPTSDFYETHRSQCRYTYRQYTVNSKSGTVCSSTTPLTKDIYAVYKNGKTMVIECIYTGKDGKEWGLLSRGYDEWIPMDEMELVYDNTSFNEDHKAEFFNADDLTEKMTEVQDIVLWKYPNSGVISSTISKQSVSNLYTGDAYMDPSGKIWVYMPYYQIKRGWICLADPSATDIESIVVTPSKEPEPTPVKSEEPAVTTTPAETKEPVSDLPEGVTVSFDVENDWGSNLQGAITIQNDSDKDIKGWTLTFDESNPITSLWVSTLTSQEDNKAVVKCPAWAPVIEPGKSEVIHFIQTTVDDSKPCNFVLTQAE